LKSGRPSGPSATNSPSITVSPDKPFNAVAMDQWPSLEAGNISSKFRGLLCCSRLLWFGILFSGVIGGRRPGHPPFLSSNPDRVTSVLLENFSSQISSGESSNETYLVGVTGDGLSGDFSGHFGYLESNQVWGRFMVAAEHLKIG